MNNNASKAKTPVHPSWKRDGDDGVVLLGSWSSLVDERDRRRLTNELSEFAASPGCRWILREVNSLDSTGALLLWHVWDGRLPSRLDCSEAQRNLFKWLEGMTALGKPVRRGDARWLERVGAGVLLVLRTGAGIFILLGQVVLDFAYCVRHPRVMPWREISANVRHVGASALLLLGSIGFLVGAVMTIQVGLVLEQFGAASMVISMMATAVPRELGAVVTGLLMAGRTGSAMTASIGAMRITEEYSALQVFGVSPSLRLTLPRVIGAAVAMPLLVVWADCAIALGSAVAAEAQLGIDYQLFIQQLVDQVRVVNFWLGLGKGLLFGVIIAVVGCYFGMTSSPDTDSMSSHTTISVVTSLTAVLLCDMALGAALTNVGLM